MGPGGGAPRSPDGGGMIADLDQRKEEMVATIDSQKESSISEVKRSVEAQMNEYKGRKNSILKGVADLRNKLSGIPDVPQAKEVRKKLTNQLNQMRAALDQINKSLDYMKQHSERQKAKLSTQFELRKREVITSFQAQKSQLLVRIASQRMMMAGQMQAAAMGQKSPESGRVKG